MARVTSRSIAIESLRCLNCAVSYTHLLFDHDGVLVDTEPLYFEATVACLEMLGITLPLDEYLTLQADGANAWLRARDLGHSESVIVAAQQKRNVLYQDLIRSRDIEIANVTEVLGRLADQYTLAIVTTAKQEDFDLIHQDPRIVRHFDLILTNRDYTHSKPHPEPYLTALEKLGVAPENALVVEDSERGLKAAVAAGIDCAAVYHAFTEPQDFSQARYRVRDLLDLESLLADLGTC